MISGNDLRKGLTFEWDGGVWQVIDFQHVKPGKGAAFVRTKLKNVMTATTKDVTFNPNDKFNEARIETKEMQYLYNDGQLYYFMDTETYEQIPVDRGVVENAIKYLKENDMGTLHIYQGSVFDVEAPNFVELEVIETEPGIKGDTASGGSKPAKVETGATINVPLFVNTGDVIRIDTRNNSYMSRA